MPSQSTVARAFEIAREGKCRALEEIRRQLKSEGFENIEQHFQGRVIKQQLLGLMRATKDKGACNLVEPPSLTAKRASPRRRHRYFS